MWETALTELTESYKGFQPNLVQTWDLVLIDLLSV